MAKTPDTEEDDTPPGDDGDLAYAATGTKRVAAPRQFLWFVTNDRKRDQIFPFADIRRMEPPDNPDKEVAFIHFSGVSVALFGRHLRKVIHRITINRTIALYEFRRGQTRPPDDEPIIDRMEFMDMTKATPKADPVN